MSMNNRQPVPGSPPAIVRWWDLNRNTLQNYQNVHDVGTLVTQVNNTFDSQQDRLDALIMARHAIGFSSAADAQLGREIGELAKWIHRHPFP
jgi:hypothetical protein